MIYVLGGLVILALIVSSLPEPDRIDATRWNKNWPG